MQREGELGHRDRVLPGQFEHVDAAPGRRRDVDRVVAGAGADRPATAIRLSSIGPVTCGAADDQHVGRRLAQRLHQRVVLEVGLIDDVAAGGLEAVDAALFELVGDEDFS